MRKRAKIGNPPSTKIQKINDCAEPSSYLRILGTLRLLGTELRH